MNFRMVLSCAIACEQSSLRTALSALKRNQTFLVPTEEGPKPAR